MNYVIDIIIDEIRKDEPDFDSWKNDEKIDLIQEYFSFNRNFLFREIYDIDLEIGSDCFGFDDTPILAEFEKCLKTKFKKMKKKLTELVKGELVWKIDKTFNPAKTIDVFIFEGVHSDENGMTIVSLINISGETKILCLDNEVCGIFGYTTERPCDIPSTGIGFYIHNKDRKPYLMVSENFMFNDCVGFVEDEKVYDWTRGLILYQSLYNCTTGRDFARYPEDFYKNFTRIL